jgi:D-glycero-D-manno-heptose 1,7-bisphosphate phosphatase
MSSSDKRPAVFLDKDGTLVENLPPGPYSFRAALLPGVLDGLALLHRAGFALIVITNQAAVAHGQIDVHDVKKMELFLRTRMLARNLSLAGFYACPHHPDGLVEPYAVHCLCRKPKPGLILRAASDLNIDMSQSWMVGDILHDVEAGRWAGCRTVLLNNGHETEWQLTETRWPDYVAATLLEAAQLIALSIPRSPLETSTYST